MDGREATQDNIIKCILDVAQSDDASGVSLLSLGALIKWHEENSAPMTPQTTSEWIDSFLNEAEVADPAALAFKMGYGCSGTPLEEALQYMQDNGGMYAGAIGEGRTAQMMASFSLDERSPTEPHSCSSQWVIECSKGVCSDILTKVINDDLIRKPLLRCLNIVILIEEAGLEISGLKERTKQRKKLAIEYALTRLLSEIEAIQSIDDMTAIFRAIGNMSRLNLMLSDGLDRVQSYASKASGDEDIAEAGVASGRPVVTSYSDVYTAARQCRLFRDRERA